MTRLKIGIATPSEMKARTLAVAAGRHAPTRSEPKLWFTSLEGLAKVLNEPNRRLLALIVARRPGSLAELSQISGRAVSNLSRTIATMERYGLVRRRKDRRGRIRIAIPYRSVVVEVDTVAGAARPANSLGDGRSRAKPIARTLRRRATTSAHLSSGAPVDRA